jgi:hypothetical protein
MSRNCHRHNKKKEKQRPLTHEEELYRVAGELAADAGISFSEALGFVLGVKNPTYGWENEISQEEFQALLNQDERDDHNTEIDSDLPF